MIQYHIITISIKPAVLNCCTLSSTEGLGEDSAVAPTTPPAAHIVFSSASDIVAVGIGNGVGPHLDLPLGFDTGVEKVVLFAAV